MEKDKKNEERRIVDVNRELIEVGKSIDIPWHVWTTLNCNKEIEFHGNQMSLGADFVELQNFRNAVEWLTNQLGGKISWEE